MKFPTWLKVYGDTTYRGRCPLEATEQITFFNQLRENYPKIGKIALHPRNEGKRRPRQALKEIMEGMSKGAPDIIIPGSPTFCCELKRQDHTKSAWTAGQLAWLEKAKDQGAYVCVALGYEAAWEALLEWMEMTKTESK